MRINVYAEEITGEVEVITKEVTNELIGTQTFYGIRIYLASPDVLHYTKKDDDRSAITFWVPWTKEKGNEFGPFLDLVDQIRRKTVRASHLDKGQK